MQIKDTAVDTTDPSSSLRSKKGLIRWVEVSVLAQTAHFQNAFFPWNAPFFPSDSENCVAFQGTSS